VGNLVEWYDFAVFGASAVVLATVLVPAHGRALTGVFAVFALSFLLRPVGALVFARHADARGRRGALALTVAAMSLSTAAIGLLPGGGAAPAAVLAALVVLRATQGVTSGGELPVSVAFLLEHAPRRDRGYWGGVHLATMALGFALGAAAVALCRGLASPADHLAWAWRLPFLLAVPLGAIGLVLRLRAPETPGFRPWHGSRASARRLLRRSGGVIAGGLALTAAQSSSYNLWFVYLPARYVAEGRYRLTVTLGAAIIGLAALAASAVAAGRLSDRVGRRPVLVVAVLATAATWLVGPALATSGAVALVVVDVGAGVALGGFVIQSAVCDALPQAVRASGLAVSVSLGTAVVGGTAPLVASLLDDRGSWTVAAYALVLLAAALPAALVWRGATSSVGRARLPSEGRAATPA
jgi:MHS family proline/betaine transporter-like MFS transporter